MANNPSLASRLASFAVGLASGRQRLLILTYHRVLAEFDPLLPSEPTARDLVEQLAIFTETCTVLPLGAAIEHLKQGSLPRAALCITFDDGYQNNHAVALPVLREFGVSASFFIATGYLRGGLMWNDQVIESVRTHSGATLDLSALGFGTYEMGSDEQKLQSLAVLLSKLRYLAPSERQKTVDSIARHIGARLPERLMMTAAEIAALRSAGMEIGGHTVNHTILTTLSEAEAEREITHSRADLEAILGEKVGLFAYPNGRPSLDYAATHVACLRRLGFAAAVTTGRGYAASHTDVFELPRVALWNMSRLRTQLHLLRAYRGG
jgi:peptidoglycan/xylan/chitin deacetylase (PgdA/CDA1 family)